jgi:O-antigen/teichoic acid export membrane protein
MKHWLSAFLVGLAVVVVSAFTAALVPFIGWLFGWQGVTLLIVLIFTSSYFFGRVIARRSPLASKWLWPLIIVMPSFLFCIAAFVQNPADQLVCAELCLGGAMGAACIVGLRMNRVEIASN